MKQPDSVLPSARDEILRTSGDGPTEQLLLCTGVESTTHDVKTFTFEPVGPAGPRPLGLGHAPGQYLTFTFEIGGAEFHRCYTIASPPTRPHTASITVKRVPGGTVSNWLHDHLTPGTALRSRGPLGEFSMHSHPADKYLFLSAGSGITPATSMIRTLYDLADPADVIFVNSARSPEDIIFRRELERITATSKNIRVTHICEAEAPTEHWNGHRGRLTLDVLRQIAPDFCDREVFTCGPPPYMDAVRRMLTDAGFPMEHHHQETFETPPPTGTPPAADTPTFAVELTRSRLTIECDAATPLLEAASRSGITLPSSCGQGMCGSCMATLVKGAVEMQHNGGISPRDRAQNKILLCCSTPLEDLAVDA
ncbi:2Fe-2S iron-sulfur cluster-binding protein [Streptomyces sp. NPDC056982]|uniref:2Fe-2S iron-sulfur cluster-binding protein n=1 Tax=Streptomyces sp. NPDC056982 TaxID=3345986 RepID=UPI00362A7721